MTIFWSKVQIPVPYLRLALSIPRPESMRPNDYLLQSAQGPECSGYTFSKIKDAAERVGCGLNRLGAQAKNVTMYGNPSFHFPIEFLASSQQGIIYTSTNPTAIRTGFLPGEIGFCFCAVRAFDAWWSSKCRKGVEYSYSSSVCGWW